MAYLAAGRPGLVVVDISDPANPRRLADADTPRTARSVDVEGNYAYVGDLNWLRVFDISSPSAPKEIASYEAPAQTDRVWVSNRTAYVAAYDAGLLVLSLD
jgi:hypothetical protein